MSIRRAKIYIGYVVVIIVLAGCGSPDDQLPPGVAHLRQGPAGHDFDAFVVEATVESELFLEESYEISPGIDAYAITGFFYKVTGNTLRATQCFQAVYTRKPDKRPEWFSFPLELRVSN